MSGSEAEIAASLKSDAGRLRALAYNLRTTDLGQRIGADVTSAARLLELAPKTRSGTRASTRKGAPMADSDTYYRIERLLPSGEWFTASTKIDSLNRAKEDLEALRESSPEQYRLVRYAVSEPEVVDAF